MHRYASSKLVARIFLESHASEVSSLLPLNACSPCHNLVQKLVH